ncbi:protein ROOT PRIMORDIUM DEFECTIVE 1 [Amborella trichopoda]|nr:protein ROOT PRIMORDIUM DEFECTIVE 1 [Amborella trichopoda]XP_020525063.1 protein ROOT PRIMORDIUM DEFECTIVE 1 [Amborella trichopoda]XP_020525064.1 protein ROOT PRIMORDIUM DEFECTIVE 1 [Amborella trichopoda]XP_020525065.1 protein ROOT PRIMORDIUM DEFECTIVE 1 [Amborella trichopoda]XP_020525066.1 protein ROOT PRIMORDIUM DEFECTIVE 1 [Amborella trichopoda]XP_020525067.1 protein ROOT PRIMORDIUM DEFECTIVE 1 [Amborella trichopoda]XP_020525068.1 protein ROOT PRIMORDIUM DEFECTIVE 1 [Amborella trichopod|eukprot:XP_006847826.2 protein ROOT PRIMORDIUM DEFECTIVE 1 [Amborella trichopoda]
MAFHNHTLRNPPFSLSKSMLSNGPLSLSGIQLPNPLMSLTATLQGYLHFSLCKTLLRNPPLSLSRNLLWTLPLSFSGNHLGSPVSSLSRTQLRNPPFSASKALLNLTQTRTKITSVQYVETRHRDHSFEKFMHDYKHYLKVIKIQDLILANPDLHLSLSFLSKLSQKLHLNRGAPSFLRKFPHIFTIFYNQTLKEPFCKLTDTAMAIIRQESEAIEASETLVINRLRRLLLMSDTKSLPLRAIFKVWRELGLPDNFEHSIIAKNPIIFSLIDAHEPNTHILKLIDLDLNYTPEPAVDKWRVANYREKSMDESEIRFGFKHGFPPGMKLSKEFRARVREWQKLPYWGPYEDISEIRVNKRWNKGKPKAAIAGLEKRAVAIIHEFLSLTVEKMVEVEKISHFRKWFRIDLNIRDLFLDHPGLFYISTKGKVHTVFLREAYERGCLIEPNPVCIARRKMLDLVLLGRRGSCMMDSQSKDLSTTAEVGS